MIVRAGAPGSPSAAALARTDWITVAAPKVPSGLIGNRRIRPSSVPAYSRPSGPFTTVVNDAPVATPTTLSNAGPPVPPPLPVVNTIENGAKARPVTSRTPAVRLNRYAVFAASAAVGDRFTTSPPPLVIALAGTAAPSLSRVSVTVDEVSVACATPPLGSTRSSTTLVVGGTPVAPLPGVLRRTAGIVPGAGTLAMSM